MSYSVQVPINSVPNPGFIHTANTEWLDGKHVVFGRIKEDMKILEVPEFFGLGNGRDSKITIAGCDQLYEMWLMLYLTHQTIPSISQKSTTSTQPAHNVVSSLIVLLKSFGFHISSKFC